MRGCGTCTGLVVSESIMGKDRGASWAIQLPLSGCCYSWSLWTSLSS